MQVISLVIPQVKIVVFTTWLLLGCMTAHAQVCQEVELFTTAQKRSLIREYINDCHQKHHFFEDKGVVQLVAYQNPQGLLCWYLSALVDNRYLAAPPQQYAWFDNDVALVYQGDKQGRVIAASKPSAELRACLTEVVGGRVYEYRKIPAYAYYTDSNGARKKTLIKHDATGNVHNELIIVFNGDGTITKKIPS